LLAKIECCEGIKNEKSIHINYLTLLALVSCNANNDTTSNISVLASTIDDKSFDKII